MAQKGTWSQQKKQTRGKTAGKGECQSKTKVYAAGHVLLDDQAHSYRNAGLCSLDSLPSSSMIAVPLTNATQ